MRNIGTLHTMATTQPGKGQKVFAAVTCAAFSVLTFALLPIAAQPMSPMPGFVPAYQTALISTYIVTTYLFYAQYWRSGSVPLLVLSAGSLFTTLMVFVQLLTFPNVFAPGRILGNTPDTTTWLWTLWHLGPPVSILAYAIVANGSATRRVSALENAKAGRLSIMIGVFVACLATILVVRHVDLLPKTVSGDDFSLLITSGVGPFVLSLTVLALAALVWKTKLRSVLQLWLAVSLFLLVLDNVITFAGGARATVGWFAGRLEALVAGAILLAVYLRQVDFLYARAEQTAEERERERLALQLARDNLELALKAAEMGDWHLDLVTGATRRSLQHDKIFGYETYQPNWTKEAFFEHVLPEDRRQVEAAFQRSADCGVLEFMCGIRRTDGAIRRISVLISTEN